MAAEKLSMSLDAIINRNKREPARRAVRTRAEYAGDGDDRSRSYQTEPAAAAPSGSGRRLFVNNLNYSTTWMSLKDHFKTIGNVLYADVKTEGMGPNARSRGLGIVEFETVEDAQTAIQELNLSQLDGREIFVREDRPPPAREGRDRERRFDRGDGDRDAGGYRERERSFEGGFRSGGGDRGGYREREGSFEGGFRSGGGDRGGYRERERSNDGFRSEGGRGGGGGRGGAAPGCKVVVQGLPYRASWQDLKDLGREIGEVTRADVVTDRNTGRSRGWGFLEFATPQDAEAAVQGINGRDMEGRVLTAKLDEYNN